MHVWNAIRATWEDALAAGIVKGSPETAIAELEASFGVKAAAAHIPGTGFRSALDDKRRKNLAKVFADDVRSRLARFQGEFDGALLEAFATVSRRAAAEEWSEETYRQAIEALGDRAGAEDFPTSWLATWYRTAFTDAYANSAVSRFGRQPTARLFPFLIVYDFGDDRVRPNHHELDRFVARSTWPGWSYAAPPYGWNCRCRIDAVPYLVAAAAGWIDQEFPEGSEAKILTWSGPDADFDREKFDLS